VVSRIEAVVKKYISDPNAIILAVAAATCNIENEKSVAIAREVDPERLRTLVVLTKLDLATEINAYEALQGKKLDKYELGIFGVVNRSTSDRHLSYHQIRAKERHILSTKFPLVADRNGIPCLVSHVCDHLLKKISESLPTIKRTLDDRIKDYSEQLQQLGRFDENPEHRLVEYLQNFLDAYCGEIDGVRRNMDIREYSASAIINAYFETSFTLDQQNELVWTDEEISKAIYKSQPLHGIAIFYDVTDAYQEYAKQKILTLKPLVIKCAEDVQHVMVAAIQRNLDHDAGKRYPNLNNSIENVVADLIANCYKSCLEYLSDFVESESAICRFSHSQLENVGTGTEAGGSSSSGHTANGVPGQQQSNKNVLPLPYEKDHQRDMRDRADRYFKDAKITIKSHVPRAIAKKLVYAVTDKIKKAVVSLTHDGVIFYFVNCFIMHINLHLLVFCTQWMKLHQSHKIDEIMQESKELRKDKEHAQKMLEVSMYLFIQIPISNVCIHPLLT